MCVLKCSEESCCSLGASLCHGPRPVLAASLVPALAAFRGEASGLVIPNVYACVFLL